MKYPIYVISKGRYENPMTSNRLCEIGQKHFLVVEPQELEAYRSKTGPYATLLATPFSNLGQGSIPVRNFVWEHSKKFRRHWVLDDNISNFYQMKDGKRQIFKSIEGFTQIENFVDKFANVPMAGMNYTTFAIPSKNSKPFKMNTRVYSCILLSNKHNIGWRGRYNEDTDLSLRFLKMGYCTVLFNQYLIDKTMTMTMKGGNEDIYNESEGRLKFAESLRDQHPDVVKIVKKWGRFHHEVNYKPFKENKLRKVNK